MLLFCCGFSQIPKSKNEAESDLLQHWQEPNKATGGTITCGASPGYVSAVLAADWRPWLGRGRPCLAALPPACSPWASCQSGGPQLKLHKLSHAACSSLHWSLAVCATALKTLTTAPARWIAPRRRMLIHMRHPLHSGALVLTPHVSRGQAGGQRTSAASWRPPAASATPSAGRRR